MFKKEKSQLKTRKNKRSKEFITIMGSVYEGHGDPRPIGFYFKAATIKKRGEVQSGKGNPKEGIFKIGEVVVAFGTDTEVTEEHIPPSTSKILKSQLKQSLKANGVYSKSQILTLLREWITYLVLDQGYTYLGNVQQIRTEGWQSTPETIKFELTE